MKGYRFFSPNLMILPNYSLQAPFDRYLDTYRVTYSNFGNELSTLKHSPRKNPPCKQIFSCADFSIPIFFSLLFFLAKFNDETVNIFALLDIFRPSDHNIYPSNEDNNNGAYQFT